MQLSHPLGNALVAKGRAGSKKAPSTDVNLISGHRGRVGGSFQCDGRCIPYFSLHGNHYSVSFVTWGVQDSPVINGGFLSVCTSLSHCPPYIPLLISSLSSFVSPLSVLLCLFCLTGTAEHVVNDVSFPRIGWHIMGIMLEKLENLWLIGIGSGCKQTSVNHLG